jgi:microcystin-dependent protein
MNQFIGEIRLFPYTFIPKGWNACDGMVLRINLNMALFSLLGTTFGGDGKETFALPDLRGKVPLNQGAYCIAMQGAFPERV